MRIIVKLTVAIAALACGSGSALAAQPQENFCAMLPDADVSSVVGSPVKLIPDKIDTRAGLRSQSCNYDPPGGIGSGPATVRITITEASSPTIAGQMFKVETQLSPAGKLEPVRGVGDEAQAFRASGSLYMHKKNMVVYVQVGLRDLNSDKESAMAQALAQKIAARIP